MASGVRVMDSPYEPITLTPYHLMTFVMTPARG
jgi:hypothetical protein